MTYHGDATLIVGEQLIEVSAHLRAYGRRDDPHWDGTLHDVPTHLIHALHDSDDRRIRLPDGQERTIWPRDVPHESEEEFTSLPISVDGLPPF
ncbi:hypothetical protein AB0N81_24165 [Streptomyces sp. NPDC093510]|uniref:hypothetical protein n=1 Tax=Streptomyces sp. NPDC093510 TaxID=3155199 RepID=UPI00344878B2